MAKQTVKIKNLENVTINVRPGNDKVEFVCFYKNSSDQIIIEMPVKDAELFISAVMGTVEMQQQRKLQ